MNIIYKLTNLDKTSGTRFYIGSKQECKLLEVDGIPTIFGMRTKQSYYGSSVNFQFKDDFRNGNRFSAEILEIVNDKKEIRDRENYHLKSNNAVESDEYYNLSYAFINTRNPHAIKNQYGETVAEYAAAQSQTSKREGTALELGFANFGEMYFSLYAEILSGTHVKDICEKYGKQRKWVTTILKPYNMEKAKQDLSTCSKESVRDLILTGASLKKAAELLSIEIPAARVLLGDFYKPLEKSFSVAARRGKSKEELEKEITIRLADGETIMDICNSMELCRESVLRYHFRCLQNHKEGVKRLLNNATT